MRFAMRLNPLVRPLLLALGGTAERSYVEVTADTVRFRFGWGFDATVPRAAIAGTERGGWPWWGGLGWRLGFGGEVGLIGSLNGVVAVVLRQPLRLRFLSFPLRCRRIYVSLEAPEAFLVALAEGAPASP